MTSITVRVVVATALACGLATAVRAGEAAPAFDPGVARRITPDEVKRRRDAGEKAIIVDTRSAGSVIAKGAVRVPNDRIDTWAKDIPKNALIVTYCT